MVSYSAITSYFWGTKTENTVTVGNPGEAAPIFTEEVKASDIVK